MEVKYKKMTRSRGRRFCDELWKIIVKLGHQSDGKPCCAVCGSTTMIQAHHLISRAVYAYRWEPLNGVPLCPSHHEKDIWASAHHAPWWFDKWVKDNKPLSYQWWDSNRWTKSNLTADDFVYDKLYYDLEQKHKELTGNYYKIDRCQDYILAGKYEEIKAWLSDKKPVSKLHVQLGLGQTAVGNFIKKNIELRHLLKSYKKG